MSTVPGCVSLRFDVCRFNDWRGGFETVALTQRRRLVGASEGGEGIDGGSSGLPGTLMTFSENFFVAREAATDQPASQEQIEAIKARLEHELAAGALAMGWEFNTRPELRAGK
jgi:hypothetical protein